MIQGLNKFFSNGSNILSKKEYISYVSQHMYDFSNR